MKKVKFTHNGKEHFAYYKPRTKNKYATTADKDKANAKLEKEAIEKAIAKIEGTSGYQVGDDVFCQNKGFMKSATKITGINAKGVETPDGFISFKTLRPLKEMYKSQLL